jgi:hypothetical protein
MGAGCHVFVYDADYNLVKYIGGYGFGTEDGAFSDSIPQFYIAPNGYLYASDYGSNRIQVFKCGN